MSHRPEIGRTVGVASWSEGEAYCRIVCRRGHKRRLIDRVRWAGEEARGAHLYTASARLDDPTATDPGTSAEDVPDTYNTKWRFKCGCGMDVTLSNASLEKLAGWVRDTGAKEIELGTLAAMVS